MRNTHNPPELAISCVATGATGVSQELILAGPGGSVVLHTDGARAYTAKLNGVIHDNVVHKKKKVVLRGKTVWLKPKFTKILKHKLPTGKEIWVKAGTQIIDMIWSLIKRQLKGNTDVVGAASLRRKVRSAQWCYWNRGEDLWSKTGEMLRATI